MPIRCEMCNKEITDGSKKPMYLTVHGWDIDDRQHGLDVCRECFLNKNKEIFEKLERETEEYG